MKNNEEYMIPGYDFWHDEPVLERKVLASKPPSYKTMAWECSCTAKEYKSNG